MLGCFGRDLHPQEKNSFMCKHLEGLKERAISFFIDVMQIHFYLLSHVHVLDLGVPLTYRTIWMCVLAALQQVEACAILALQSIPVLEL